MLRVRGGIRRASRTRDVAANLKAGKRTKCAPATGIHNQVAFTHVCRIPLEEFLQISEYILHVLRKET
jgi:hypothetical protein